LTIPYLTCQDNLNTYHGFYRLPGTAGYLFARKGEKGLALWRLDLKLDLVVALFKPEGQAPFITNVPSAMKSLRVEFDTWRVWERTIRTPTPVP